MSLYIISDICDSINILAPLCHANYYVSGTTICVLRKKQREPSNQSTVEIFCNAFRTGESFSEALILASANPLYDCSLNYLQVQCMKIASSEHVVYIKCFLF